LWALYPCAIFSDLFRSTTSNPRGSFASPFQLTSRSCDLPWSSLKTHRDLHLPSRAFTLTHTHLTHRSCNDSIGQTFGF
jgi:hypothetical protein